MKIGCNQKDAYKVFCVTSNSYFKNLDYYKIYFLASKQTENGYIQPEEFVEIVTNLLNSCNFYDTPLRYLLNDNNKLQLTIITALKNLLALVHLLEYMKHFNLI